MNRMESQLESTWATFDPGEAVKTAVYQQPTSTDLALFAPLHYEANYDYPLVVWLHGPGCSETQLREVMPLVSMRNYVGAAPRGTSQQPASTGSRGFSWDQSDEGVSVAADRVFATLEQAAGRYSINRKRVFLAGYDAGGTMALRLGLNYPEAFAGVVSLCGSFPDQGCPLARWSAARQIPVLIASGRDSRMYPVSQVCDDLRLLSSAGMTISLRQYPGAHELTAHMLGDMNRWLMEQIAGE